MMQQEQSQEKFLIFCSYECPVLSKKPPESYHRKSLEVCPLEDTVLKQVKKTLNKYLEITYS